MRMEHSIDLSQPTQVMVVDDFSLIRELLRLTLPFYDIEVIGEADGAEAALSVIQMLEVKPDVVIIDVDMPGTSGLDAIAPIKARAPDAKILMFSTDEETDIRVRAFSEGADDFIGKDALIPEIVERIQTLAADSPARSVDRSRT